MVCRHKHCFVDRSIVLAAEALFCPSLREALFRRQEHCFFHSIKPFSTFCMSTGLVYFHNPQLFRRQEHCFGSKSTVLAQSDRSIVLAAGALFCRQEHDFVDRSIAMSTGALLYRQEHAWGLGPACWRGLQERCCGGLASRKLSAGAAFWRPGRSKTSAGAMF